MTSRRALHFVFKIGNRTETAKFFRNVLGMKVCVTHFEFPRLFLVACVLSYEAKIGLHYVKFIGIVLPPLVK